MIHGVVLSADSERYETVRDLLLDLDWSVVRVHSLVEAEAVAPDAWAFFLISPKGDTQSLACLSRLREGAAELMMFVFLDDEDALYERQLRVAGVDGVFVEPFDKTVLIDVIVKTMLTRRS